MATASTGPPAGGLNGDSRGRTPAPPPASPAHNSIVSILTRYEELVHQFDYPDTSE